MYEERDYTVFIVPYLIVFRGSLLKDLVDLFLTAII